MIIHPGWTVTSSVALLNLLAFGARISFAVFFVAMLGEFGWRRADLAGVYSVSMLMMGLSGVGVGRVLDLVGPRLFYQMGGALLALGLAASALVTRLFHLYLIWGVLLGIGTAALGVGPANAVVARWFSRRRGAAVGLVAAGGGIAGLAFAPLSEVLVRAYGWRAAYLLLGAIVAAVAIPVGSFLVRNPSPDEVETIKEAPSPERPTPRGGGEAGKFTLLSALRSPALWWLLLAWTGQAITLHFINTHAVAHLVDRGHAPLVAATALGLVGLFSGPSRLGGGALSDWIGRERAYGGGALLALLGIGILWFLSERSSPWPLYLFAALFGCGTGFLTGVLPAAAADLFSGPSFGSILGFITIGFGVGGALGPWLGGLLFDLTGSYGWMFLFVGAVLVLSGWSVFAAAPRRGRQPLRQSGASQGEEPS